MTIHKVGNKGGKIIRTGLSVGGKIIATPDTGIIQTVQSSRIKNALGRNVKTGDIIVNYVSPDYPDPTIWSPYSTTTAIWLDAFKPGFLGLTLSNKVDQWIDLSSNNRLVIQNSDSLRAVYNATGLGDGGIVSFGGNTWFPSIASFAAGSFFAVCQISSAKAFAGLFTGSQSEMILNGTGDNAITTTGYSVRINGSNTTVIPLGSNYFIWSLTKSVASQQRVIGQEFNLQGTSRSWTGSCAEIIAFPGILSNTQVEIVEGYLAWKWELVNFLPLGHPYKNSFPPYNISF